MTENWGRGGGVGVECSPTDAKDLDLNPGGDINFLFQSSHQFSATVYLTLTLDIGLSYLSVVPLQFAKLTNAYFFPILSSSVCKLYKVNKCSFCLYSLSLSVGTQHTG